MNILNSIFGGGDVIKYRSGYKYVLDESVYIQTTIYPRELIVSDREYVTLRPDGVLIIKEGYAWNGANKPAINTKSFRRGSLVHDALYQLLAEGLLSPVDFYRKHADRLLQRICIEDGMWKARAWYVYQTVRFGGAKAALKINRVLTAP